MKRVFTSALFGLLLAVIFLGIVFATDGAILHLHWLRDIFIGPPLWLLQTGLPSISPIFAIERGGPYSGITFLIAFFLFFWCVVCSILILALRRPPPNYALKGTSV